MRRIRRRFRAIFIDAVPGSHIWQRALVRCFAAATLLCSNAAAVFVAALREVPFFLIQVTHFTRTYNCTSRHPALFNLRFSSRVAWPPRGRCGLLLRERAFSFTLTLESSTLPHVLLHFRSFGTLNGRIRASQCVAILSL